MKRIKTISSLIALCGLASLLIWQHELLTKLRAENEALRGQMEQPSPLPVAQPSPDDNALTQEQMSELLKLRGEVTQLRGQANEIASLREQNEKLLASLTDLKPAQTNAVAKKKGPEDALPQDIHPRDSWGFRGYDSPDATAESTVWAMAHGDEAAFMAAFSPEMRAELDKLPNRNFADEMKSNDMGEFRVLDRQTLSEDEVVLSIYSTRKDKTGEYVGDGPEDTTFKKIGGQWKISKPGGP
ncbi:MAG TPA: hypothetical protein VG938_07115 [Verrucomicrobiae bacterium]|jgi:hypothetical protein|nr:hypothetical protein [Verrucomicrobiae bacterium]